MFSWSSVVVFWRSCLFCRCFHSNFTSNLLVEIGWQTQLHFSWRQKLFAHVTCHANFSFLASPFATPLAPLANDICPTTSPMSESVCRATSRCKARRGRGNHTYLLPCAEARNNVTFSITSGLFT